MSYRQIVLVGPSASGKTRQRDLLVAAGAVRYGVTCTTREPRPGERPGYDYDFISRGEFVRGQETGNVAEATRYIGNASVLYGILRQRVEEAEHSVLPTLWILDTNGLEWVRQRWPGQTIGICLFADRATLRARLEERARANGTPLDEAASRLRKLNEEVRLAKAVTDKWINTGICGEAEVAGLIRRYAGV